MHPKQKAKHVLQTLLAIVLLGSLLLSGTGVPSAAAAPAEPDDPSGSAPQASTTSTHLYLPSVVRGFPWNNPLGIESNLSLASGTYNSHMVSLSPGWARLNGRVSWRKLQPEENGPIRFEFLRSFEKELKALKAAGVRPIVTVDDYPYWATVAPNACSAIRAEKFSAFADFMRTLVKRYSTPEYNVYDWELGNEVDVDPSLVPVDSIYGCWGDINDPFYGGRHYGEMVKVVGQAIKTEVPRARVWLGGLMVANYETTDPNLGKPEKFLNGILEAGAAPYFDVVAFHGHISYYGGVQDSDTQLSGGWIPMGGGVRGKARFIRSILASYGVEKPLFLDETAIGCPDYVASCSSLTEEFLQFQADLGVRVAVRAVTENLEGFIWYALNEPGWRHTGLVDESGAPKPAFYSYGQLIQRISKAKYEGPVNYGAGIEAYTFCNGKQCTDVLWAENNTTIPVQFSPANFVAAYDRNGVNTPPASVGDQYQVNVGFAPVYIVRNR